MSSLHSYSTLALGLTASSLHSYSTLALRLTASSLHSCPLPGSRFNVTAKARKLQSPLRVDGSTLLKELNLEHRSKEVNHLHTNTTSRTTSKTTCKNTCKNTAPRVDIETQRKRPEQTPSREQTQTPHHHTHTTTARTPPHARQLSASTRARRRRKSSFTAADLAGPAKGVPGARSPCLTVASASLSFSRSRARRTAT